MKTKLLIVGTILAIATLVPAATNDLTAALQRGLFEEEGNRDYAAAISAYQSLAAQFDQSRQVAATAIFRLGECYRKLGKTNEAVVQYERIVREFSDQPTLATLSRQNIAELGQSNQSITAPPAPQTVGRNSERLRELALIKKLQAMSSDEIAQVAPTLLTDATLINLINQCNQTDLEILRLKVEYPEDHPVMKKQVAIMQALGAKLFERLEGLARALSLEQTVSATGGNDSPHPLIIADDEEKEILRIQAMIQNSPDLLNAQVEEGTPLFQAASKGQLRVASYLLDHGAEINARSFIHNSLSFGWTPLIAATDHGQKAMVELLLSRGADVNAGCENGGSQQDGLTALHFAVRRKFRAVFEVLLAHKADVNAASAKRRTPLQLTAEAGDIVFLQLLLKNGAAVNATDSLDMTALAWAASKGQTEAIKELLAAKADPNVEDNTGRTPLSVVAGNGQLEAVKALLAAKADPNAGTLNLPLFSVIESRGQSPKDAAALCELLLQAGADPNKIESVKLQSHLWQGQSGQHSSGETIKASPIQMAVARNQTEIAKLLLDHKADPNSASPRGFPLLYEATMNSNPEIAAALLAHGANINAQGWGNWTALHYAASVGMLDLVELLLANKAEVNARVNGGDTPLDFVKRNMAGNATGTQRKAWSDIAVLLHQHGALDDLPDFNTIRVTRFGSDRPSAVFTRDTNSINHFTLLEVIRNFYYNPLDAREKPFPDFSKIIIHRPADPGKSEAGKEITVNLLTVSNSFDCTKDTWMEFGDVVEIPEREHTLAEQKIGITEAQNKELNQCLKGTVTFVVRGQKSELMLNGSAYTCWLQTALGQVQNLLRSSSDLSHIKIKRTDPATKKTTEFIADSKAPQQDNIWLRDGDVIEVPDK